MKLDTANVSSEVKVTHTNTGDNKFRGVTCNRPKNVKVGFMYFDTDLNKPIWYGNAGWIDANGTSV